MAQEPDTTTPFYVIDPCSIATEISEDFYYLVDRETNERVGLIVFAPAFLNATKEEDVDKGDYCIIHGSKMVGSGEDSNPF